MKTIIQSLFLTLLINSMSIAKEYRAFTDKNGRVINARVIDYKPSNNKVIIERDNKVKASIPLSILSQTDQDYVRNWMAGQSFLNPKKLSVSIQEKTKIKKEREADGKSKKTAATYQYTINIKSSDPLNGLCIDYQCPISRQKLDNSHIPRPFDDHYELYLHNNKKVLADDSSLRIQKNTKTQNIALRKLGRYAMTTDVIVAYEAYVTIDKGEQYNLTNQAWERNRFITPFRREEVEGIILRLSWTIPNTDTLLERFVFYPEGLANKYKWQNE